MAEISEKPTWWRTAIVSVCSIGAAFALFNFDSSPPLGVIAVCLSLLAAPFLFRIASIGPQLIARALWWQAAFLGALILFEQPGKEEALMLAASGFGAALVAGRVGLANTSASFLPVAFRRTLMFSLVLAIADFEALLLYGSIFLEEAYGSSFFADRFIHALSYLGAAAAMGVSIFGLYRLKMWGLAACVLSNVAVATMAITGVFDLPDVLTFGLTATAVVQLFLPLPLVRQMLRVRRLA